MQRAAKFGRAVWLELTTHEHFTAWLLRSQNSAQFQHLYKRL
jgi:hypothetical protein